MPYSDDFVEGEFMRNFLHSLCQKNITTLNLGKDPWLRGLRAVTKHLEDKTKDKAENDLACVVYRMLFHHRGDGLYGALNATLSVTAGVTFDFAQGQGATYDFSAYQNAGWRRSGIPDIVELVDELAEVFAKAYFNGSDNG